MLKEKVGSDVKVGTMGFCMGGGFALLGACTLKFDFCVDHYGLIQNIDEVQGLACPVQLTLAGEDERVNNWVFQSFLPAATRFRKRVVVHLCPDARHAFHRLGWEGHNPEATNDAWEDPHVFLEVRIVNRVF